MRGGAFCTVIGGTWLVAALVACGDDGTAECQASFNWRAETPDGVVCKGAPGCICTGGQVCSISVTDRSTNPWTVTARCSALEAADEYAMVCDGPEDCGDGDICCAHTDVGGGSSCTPASDCPGIVDTVVLCRSDDHCTFPGHSCRPAERGSFYDGVVGFCD